MDIISLSPAQKVGVRIYSAGTGSVTVHLYKGPCTGARQTVSNDGATMSNIFPLSFETNNV